ncbi:MAG: NADAR family protein [Bacilli bacterium]|nr:NADAR family protein [Bacilli bacterium]
MKLTDKYVFFWASILGNWSKVKDGIIVPAKYSLNGEEDFKVPTSEHLFMFLKAKFFGDFEVAKAILDTPDPKTAKKLGRAVRGFNEKKWEEYREKAMWIAIELRYISDQRFRDYLGKPEFEGKKFVEANPYDKIWSCGYLEDDPRVDLPEETWPGLNLLGHLLDKLREKYVKSS